MQFVKHIKKDSEKISLDCSTEVVTCGKYIRRLFYLKEENIRKSKDEKLLQTH